MSSISNVISFCKNSSSNSVTEEYWGLEGKYRVNGQVTAAFMLLFLAVGLPWNVMVVITVLKKRLYHQPAILLLLNLAVTDILMLLIHLPIIAVTGIAGKYLFGSTDMMRCQFCTTGFISMMLIMNSLFVVALMSLDRFLFIYKPLEYERKATPRRTLAAITVIAMLSVTIGSSSYAVPEAMYFRESSLSCILNHPKYGYIVLLITAAFIALAVIIFCNIWTIYIVQKNIKAVYKVRKLLHNRDKESYSQRLSEILSKKCHKKQLHLFRVFGGLLLSNIITWIPTIVVEMSRFISDPPLSISSASNILFLSQLAVHPILETTLISDVREPLKEMVTCACLKKKNNLSIVEKQTCCRHMGDHGPFHNTCFLLKLIDVALLPQATSNSTTSTTCPSDLNQQKEHGPADEIL